MDNRLENVETVIEYFKYEIKKAVRKALKNERKYSNNLYKRIILLNKSNVDTKSLYDKEYNFYIDVEIEYFLQQICGEDDFYLCIIDNGSGFDIWIEKDECEDENGNTFIFSKKIAKIDLGYKEKQAFCDIYFLLN